MSIVDAFRSTLTYCDDLVAIGGAIAVLVRNDVTGRADSRSLACLSFLIPFGVSATAFYGWRVIQDLGLLIE